MVAFEVLGVGVQNCRERFEIRRLPRRSVNSLRILRSVQGRHSYKKPKVMFVGGLGLSPLDTFVPNLLGSHLAD